MTSLLPTNTAPAEVLARLGCLIGHTPLLAIDYTFDGQPRTVYAKHEQVNLTGSIKDRMALGILTEAYETGHLKPGDEIAEATSGNSGIALAALGAALGHAVTIFLPSWMSRERTLLMTSYGARIVSVTPEEGGFLGSIRLSEEYAASRENVFLPCQFANQANVRAHEHTTGPEIWQQLGRIGVKLGAFAAGVGTGGTVMGVGRFLKAQDAGILVHPVEPAESPTLTTGYKVGKHRIQGISDEFIPRIMRMDEVDAPLQVSDGDSILMAQKLMRQLGLGIGISCGCNFLAAVCLQSTHGAELVVATVFSDDSRRYLSTDLLREEPVKPHYLAPRVELTGMRVLR